MSVREHGYSFYGMTDVDVKNIVEYCRSDRFNDNERLMECAREANTYLAEQIYESIICKKSYEKISQRNYIPYAKNDFYAYRRKCIAKYWKDGLKSV